MEKKVGIIVLILMALAIAVPVFAISERVDPVDGYGVHDYILRPDPIAENIMYGAGLDVVYAELCDYMAYIDPDHHQPCGDGHLTRCFLHVEAVEMGDKIQINLHDYNGIYIVTLCEINPPGGAWSAWPQCVKLVKLDPENEKIWFSYTLGTANDWWYTVDWDPTLLSYPAAATPQFRMDCNWEVEWSTDPTMLADGGQGGRAFFAGLNSSSWDDPHSVWVDTGGGNLQMVVKIKGNSCGFAFDNEGNLWSGAYTVETTEPNRLFMWTAADLDAAADSPGTIVLQIDLALPYPPAVILDLPGVPPQAYFGASDVECDPDGNVYVSCNLYLDPYGHKLVKVENDGVFPWPVQGDMVTLADAVEFSWTSGFRSLSYDGVTNLGAGGVADPSVLDQPTGNRLYIDLDYGVATSNPDQVTGICAEIKECGIIGKDDTDEDDVPDCLDNAWNTANGPREGYGPYNFVRKHQYDTNNDMYGNICDCDVDNDNIAAGGDYNKLLFDWGTYGPDTDFDSDGDVAGGDFNNLISRWNQNAPFK